MTVFMICFIWYLLGLAGSLIGVEYFDLGIDDLGFALTMALAGPINLLAMLLIA